MKKLFVVILFVLIVKTGAFAQTKEFNLGLELAGKGDFQTALKHFQNISPKILSDKQNAQIHYNIGVCYYRLNEPQKAVVEFEIAIRLKKNYEKAFYALGMAQTDLQNWDEAKTAFQQAIKLSKGRNGEAWFDFAFVLIEQKEFENALEAFQNAVNFKSVASMESERNVEILTNFLNSKDKTLLAKLAFREVR